MDVDEAVEILEGHDNLAEFRAVLLVAGECFSSDKYRRDEMIRLLRSLPGMGVVRLHAVDQYKAWVWEPING